MSILGRGPWHGVLSAKRLDYARRINLGGNCARDAMPLAKLKIARIAASAGDWRMAREVASATQTLDDARDPASTCGSKIGWTMAYEGMIAETIAIRGNNNEPISAYVA